MGKIKLQISDIEFARLKKLYDKKHVTCPKCGRVGLLNLRTNTGKKNKYFYCKHGDDSCYIARIEDIEKVMNATEREKTEPQKFFEKLF